MQFFTCLVFLPKFINSSASEVKKKLLPVKISEYNTQHFSCLRIDMIILSKAFLLGVSKGKFRVFP